MEEAFYHDNPEWDCTDYAHPAWWRGCNHGVEQVCEIIEKALEGDYEEPPTFGSKRLTDAIRRLLFQLEPEY